jgi:hypothetical protein
MSNTVRLLRADGTLQEYSPSGRHLSVPASVRFTSRIAYAAAHVVLDPIRTADPIGPPVIDWEATLRYREYLWSLGFRVAEAMDTSQRGMGLDWALAKELIERSAKSAASVGGNIASGAGTDHLNLAGTLTLEDVLHAYEEQCAAVEAAGSRIILMASRALAKIARSLEEYVRIYSRILEQTKEPVILHWLGAMFDPALEGYWGSNDARAAMENCLAVIRQHAKKVEGVKISLLDAGLEIEMRRQLPEGVRMYTGDDFNYDQLILGDDEGHSDALLGIFDAIAPAAALALQALDSGDTLRYNELLAPTIPLSRHIFRKPTFYYKTGIVFLAWLNGFQSHFHMVSGHESARSVAHLCELYRLADAAGLLRDPELAAQRMKLTLALAGIA